jgi:hypothetical protein
MIKRSIVAAVLIALVVPSAAAAKKFTGQSEQRKLVKLWTRPNGEVRAFAVRWDVRKCENGTNLTPIQTGFVHPLRESRPGSFSDQGAFTQRFTDARVRLITSAKGAASPSGRAWTGTFKVRAEVEFHDGSTDTCRLGPISWTARR